MKIFLRLVKYIKPFKKHLAISILCTFLYAMMHGISVYLTIPLLGTLFNPDKYNTSVVAEAEKATSSISVGYIDSIKETITQSFETFVLSGSISEILFKMCGLIFIAFLFKNVFAYLQAYFLGYVEQGLVRDYRNHLYSHMQKLSLAFFKNSKTGDLISRIASDVNTIQASISTVFLSLFREPVTLLVLLGIAFSISWKLTLFSFIIVPISVSIIGVIGLALRKESLKLQRNLGALSTFLYETITGVKIVKAFGRENYEISRFGQITQKYFKIVLKKVRIRNIAGPSSEIVAVSVGAVMLYYGGQLVLVDKTLNPEEFLGFLFAIFQMMPPMKNMSKINNKVQEAIAAGQRLFEIIDREPTIKDSAEAISKKEFDKKIEFNNVSFKYDTNGDTILDKINFQVDKGEIIALVGSSGAGKSTLIDLIPRFYDPQEGAVLIDNKDIRDIKIEDLRSMIGIVTQETVLFNQSIEENIRYGKIDATEEEIIEAAKAANAHNFITELRDGYRTVIGERGTKLSGGQRQRISIARALLKNPPIMIFDEATSALDNESEVLVQEAIERMMKERTTFVIAHRLSTIRNADIILVMEKGKIIQSGKHEELLEETNGVYKKLYELQFRSSELESISE